MPSRVIDFDSLWASDKLAACAPWARVEYAWLYGLADAWGCFEITNLRVVHGRVAAIREDLTIERLSDVFGEFENHGLLFVWERGGKRFAHFTGSDRPGRLPPQSLRGRYSSFTPKVPQKELRQYLSRFSNGHRRIKSGSRPTLDRRRRRIGDGDGDGDGDGGGSRAATGGLHPAWKLLGVDRPIGNPIFQGEWESWFEAQPPDGRPRAEVVEDFIQFRQALGKKIPHQFFEAKHQLEGAESTPEPARL